MKLALDIFDDSLKKYIAHQARAFSQFHAIEKLLSSISETTVGLWIDHKQKILPMIYQEGQLEYFGKKGMSLLGAMLVRRVVKKIKDKDVIGLEYIFYDTIIQNYSLQDN